MRRWVWRVLLIAAALAALTVGAAAADSDIVVQNRIKYDLSTGTVLGGENDQITEANIKDAVRGVKITAIADGAFSSYEGLGTLTIPSSIQTIGDNAFRSCEKLSTVVIPENVTKIGEGAFYGCKGLKTLTFRDKVVLDSKGMPVVQQVTEIGPSAFAWCENLQDLTLSGSISTIGDNAFSKCDKMLTKVIIPEGVTNIGKLAFGQCSKLSVISIPASVGAFNEVIFGGNTNLKVVHYGGKVEDILPGLPPELTGDAGEEGKYVHTTTSLLPNAKAPSCTKEGSVEESVTCPEKCTGLNSERKLPKLEHDYNWSSSVDISTPHPCQDQKWTYTGTCSKCGNVKTETETIKASASHTERETTEAEQDDKNFIKEKVDATCEKEGYKIVVTKICTVCGKELETKAQTIDKIDHTYDSKDDKDHILIPATCESEGLKVIDQVCSKCGHVEDPTADCPTCKAYWEKETPTEAETTAYIAHVKAAVNATDPAAGGHGGTDVPVLGHTYEKKPYTLREASCERSGISVPRNTCSRCGDVEACADCDAIKEALKTAADLTDTQKTHLETHGEITVTPAPGHKIEKIEDKEATGYKAPTCTEAGHIIYKEVECSVCHTKVTPAPEDPEALGHDWQKVEGDNAIIKEATCKEEGQKKVGKEECTRCDAERGGTIEPIPRKPHTWTNPEPDETKEDVPATCGTEGESHVISTCSVCGTKESRTIKTPPTGQHNWGEWTTTEPTETQAGEKKRTCADCGKEDVVVLPATGGSSDPEDPDNPDDPDDPDKPEPTYLVNLVQGAGGSVSANKSSAASGDRVTLTTWAESGYELDMVRVISASGGVPSLTELGGGQYRFTMPASNVEVRVTFQRKDSGSAWSSRWASAPGEGSDGNPRRTTDPMPTQNPTQSVPRAGVSGQLFRDIPASHWAAGEISWANQMGYMNGSAGRFNPDGTITHQQMWMVLARLTGSRPANMTEARRWAVENSFADGSSPDGAVARHQLVTALYRCAHLMGSTNRNTTSLAGYADSRTVPAVARDAFSWAVANGIVGGTSNGRLDPNGTLTRAQFAVILYRYSQRI